MFWSPAPPLTFLWSTTFASATLAWLSSGQQANSHFRASALAIPLLEEFFLKHVLFAPVALFSALLLCYLPSDLPWLSTVLSLPDTFCSLIFFGLPYSTCYNLLRYAFFKRIRLLFSSPRTQLPENTDSLFTQWAYAATQYKSLHLILTYKEELAESEVTGEQQCHLHTWGSEKGESSV